MDELIILKPFFLRPMQKYGVRELSRITKLDTKTVMKYLQAFTRRKIIVKKQEKGKFPYYEADRTSYAYRHEKREFLFQKIIKSGLIDYLEKRLHPKTLVLFGSVAKGTYHQESDIDLFVQTDYKRIDLTVFNRRIGHPIQLLFEPKMQNLSKGLRENIYNGLVIMGQVEAVA